MDVIIWIVKKKRGKEERVKKRENVQNLDEMLMRMNREDIKIRKEENVKRKMIKKGQ